MATIDDVAKAAGVSASTVSYVLSGKRPISAPTRARVERAIEKLGYRPHAGARALASARTNVIALMAPLRVGVNVPVIMQFVTGVVTRARDFDHDVLLLTQDDVSGLDRVTGGSMVDALVMMDIEADDPRVPVVAAAKQPTVLIGLPEDPEGLSCVDLDFEAAGRLAVRHLAAAGHTDVALIGSPPEVLLRHTSYADRLMRGLRGQAKASDVTVKVEACDASPAGASEAVDTLLATAPDTTGIIVHNEAALPHVLSRLADRGIVVGADMSVVAVCPTDVALSQRIAMTSIDLPAEDIGRVAVDMVMARLDGEQPSETRLLAPVLTERESSAPGPAADDD
ncbi:LacI family DNA-binding transcriptional regulator [Myceligenerans pegani]|uniref:LacI family DNA-binding transcriptional regulator n=1 Tax=Myceligenerans pegani TaxID=2776917 RepID=A0ABR9MV34_9MICO|nr:LacI family DNA-binding transcriptional regulator [Myceligenerans sp. TRM 65318]MBE1874866.1 LacI family DNA-binding transcriptional regulator [Myceligenerans sp. TRM 65318]MBE3017137.1 LacI family DNA-binding transcriptional regulator [Myceligenerans sp. TRM 65318]